MKDFEPNFWDLLELKSSELKSKIYIQTSQEFLSYIYIYDENSCIS